MTSIFRWTAAQFAFCAVFAGIVSAQQSDGIPVTNPLVIAKCGTCHARDERGNMERISWARTTPEGWQGALKQMILLHDLQLTPPEARTIVRYLGASHGLAPEEARPVMYDPERRIHEEDNIPSDSLREACAKCHPFARALEWRRSSDDWKTFLDSHAERYKVRKKEEALAFLAKAALLRTPEWEAWNAGTRTSKLAGRWLTAAYIPGRGNYFGEMLIDSAGDDEYTTRVTLKSVTDGSVIVRSGRSAVFAGYAWRGRSSGSPPAKVAPDDLSSEAREVMWIAPDQSTAEGRWFWGQYQEFEFNVKLLRASSSPALITLHRSSLKTGSQANRIRLIGDRFPAQVTPADLDFGPGLVVRGIVSNTASEVVAEVDVAANAPLGKRSVAFRGLAGTAAIAIYDRIDYIKVSPDSAVSAFSDRTRQKGYMQFDAIGYQRGSDGKSHTPDDVALGPVDVTWAIQVFHADDGASGDFVGAVNPSGLFTPAADPPDNNFDVWVVATASREKDQNGTPLVGKSYMVVTLPTYTFNGRRYVRDLDRWVDDGPVSTGK